MASEPGAAAAAQPTGSDASMDQEDKAAKRAPAVAGLCGAVLGASVAPAAAMGAVNAAGFTAGGIQAGSWAAAAMSSAAVAGSGEIAAGSTIAVLQTCGAAGLGSFAIVGASVAGALIFAPLVAVSVFCIVKTTRSGLGSPSRDYVSGRWFVATEEGIGNVLSHGFDDESGARRAMGEIWPNRVLFDATGQEVECRGINPWAHSTIRRIIEERKKYHQQQQSQQQPQDRTTRFGLS
jgi:hypothetical protein